MKITQCSDKNAWNRWCEQQNQPSFLQSWQWGEFQESIGNTPIRLLFLDNDSPVGQVQGFFHSLGLGLQYLYIPRWGDETISAEMKEGLLFFAKEHGCVFMRIEPTGMFEYEPAQTHTVHTRQPQDEWILDISLAADDLLQAMHSKTRYNIRLAERKGVSIKEKKDAHIFWQLNQQTTDRDQFKSHGKTYYEKMLENDLVTQFTAFYNAQPIASIVCLRFGDTMTYVHGASGNQHRNVMAPYLLQWHAIACAQEAGLQQYNFGGVAPAVSRKTSSFHGYTWEPTHRFTGITRFKVGFGGHVQHFPEALDVVLRPGIYSLYQLARKVRGLK